jgi:hypothetical protein
VFLASAGRRGNPRRGARVGELDEEMVYESRVGDVFLLGSTSWRIEEITPDRVLVTPAPARPPGCRSGRATSPVGPVELGRAIGGKLREIAHHGKEKAATDLADGGLDAWAVDNLLAYVDEQREATRHLPDDKTVLVERFRDELGDWRLAVHCLLGAKVNGAWALAIGRRLTERFGVDAQVLPSDDGIVVRLPDMLDTTGSTRRPGPTWWCSTRRRRRSWSRSRSAAPPCSRPGSGSAPRGRCCCPAVTRAGASRCGSSGSGRRSCWTWPASTTTSRSPWRRPGSACRTCWTCPAWSA